MKLKTLLLGSAVCMGLSIPVHANMWKMNVDEKVEKMKSDLNLTPEQAEKVKPVIQDYKNTMEKAHKDKEGRLNGILTPQQMDQLKAMYKDKDSDDKD